MKSSAFLPKRAVLLGFLAFALTFLVSTAADAQSLAGTTWRPESDALATLQSRGSNLKANLAAAVPGSMQQGVAHRRLRVYSLAIDLLQTGTTTDSVIDKAIALGFFIDEDEALGIPAPADPDTEQYSLRTEMLALISL